MTRSRNVHTSSISLTAQHNCTLEFMSPAAEVGNVAMEGHKRFLCNVELCICQHATRPRCHGNATMPFSLVLLLSQKHFVMLILPVIVTTWHQFTWRQRLYSEFTSPATINVLALCSAWHLCQILSKTVFSRQSFIIAPTSNFMFFNILLTVHLINE